MSGNNKQGPYHEHGISPSDSEKGPGVDSLMNDLGDFPSGGTTFTSYLSVSPEFLTRCHYAFFFCLLGNKPGLPSLWIQPVMTSPKRKDQGQQMMSVFSPSIFPRINDGIFSIKKKKLRKETP